jgi:hypothetical protein
MLPEGLKPASPGSERPLWSTVISSEIVNKSKRFGERIGLCLQIDILRPTQLGPTAKLQPPGQRLRDEAICWYTRPNGTWFDIQLNLKMAELNPVKTNEICNREAQFYSIFPYFQSSKWKFPKIFPHQISVCISFIASFSHTSAAL